MISEDSSLFALGSTLQVLFHLLFASLVSRTWQSLRSFLIANPFYHYKSEDSSLFVQDSTAFVYLINLENKAKYEIIC